MKNRAVVETQPLPTKGEVVVQNMLYIGAYRHSRYRLVIQDIQARGEMGKQKYGTYLMTHNSRNADLDLYQELCDAIAYSTQGMLEEEDEEQLASRSRDTDMLFALAWKCRGRLVEEGILSGS